MNEIEDVLKLDRIICLSGIRRYGKSTLMFQLIDRLIKSNIEPKRIVYAKADDLVSPCEDNKTNFPVR
ncbi:MAG: hypothetical protein CVT89_01515 [Candidatus Altiarchaeales archaeon HGW-Altiarchaeales-2]|nr:MAG: hypothetical protein CVT89_01515 [Candidatus Altiarchaeales archaeon HGW-Altiarchaeales-2]